MLSLHLFYLVLLISRVNIYEKNKKIKLLIIIMKIKIKIILVNIKKNKLI